MLMKVFNKGQVVIPAAIRKQLEIHPGDMLDVHFDAKRACIELKKSEPKVDHVAGALASFGARKSFPTRKQMREALAKGMSHEA